MVQVPAVARRSRLAHRRNAALEKRRRDQGLSGTPSLDAVALTANAAGWPGATRNGDRPHLGRHDRVVEAFDDERKVAAVDGSRLSAARLGGVTVKITDLWRLLFPLCRHLGRVGLARNATGPKLLSCQVILGRPVFFADFGGHHLPSRSQ
jgi:hypothetical protein